jgi:hypothetical protein
MSLTSGTLVCGAGLLRVQMRVQACREGVHLAAFRRTLEQCGLQVVRVSRA